MAYMHANEKCKAVIHTLPERPPPKLEDFLHVIAKRLPVMTRIALEGDKKDGDVIDNDQPTGAFSPDFGEAAVGERQRLAHRDSGKEQRYLAIDSAHQAIIHHYMDDVLVCTPNDDLLAHALDLTVNALVAAGFELQESKIQKMPPWKYLGLEIGKQTIVPQKLAIRTKIETLADVHHLCAALNWVKPWLGLTTEDLAPLFNLLKGGEGLSSPRSLTPEAQKALEKVQNIMSMRQASRCEPSLPFKHIILGNRLHLHGVIFQWDKGIVTVPRKDRGRRDSLLIIACVFCSHHWSKRMMKPQELMADLIRKARIRIRELAGCDFECIHVPIQLKSGQITKAMLEYLLQENEALQFALDSYSGQISIHWPAHKIFNSEVQFKLALESVQSRKPLEALTIFTDASGGSHKSVMTWKDPQTQQWESDVAEVEGSPQVAELAAVIRAFERFSGPFN
ncbi:hypothetical protein HGM15179_013464 [Zosterops borbonicus]|uniref:ribonuclease H n=1 Tax=Zosterops borbonicus TaxID=364589 RepID=A0A8K1G8J0_9PASS|nr:hypothetical protein HGM15179_013464 [Zosterops borbonicus]